MASTGFVAFGTCADDAGIGTVAWVADDLSSPLAGTEVSADEGTTAGCFNAQAAVTHYLKCTNAAVSALIPAGATINGAEIRFRRLRGVAVLVVTGTLIKFVREGTVVGNDIGNADDWPTTEAAQTVGSSTELGGQTWTRAQAVAATSGCVISITFENAANAPLSRTHEVDLVEINWYYTPAGSGYDNLLLMGMGPV